MIINAHPATEATPVGFIPPQLLGTARAIPESPGWLYERKFDGYRANVILDGASARIFTRGGHDWTEKLSSLVPALARIGRFASLDGEVCAASDDDRTDFSRLCQSLGTGRPLTFFAFDLLSLDGVDLRGRPLIERKRLLAELLDHLPIDDPVRQVPFAMRDGGALFAKMQRDGHEGIVAKKTSSLYRSGARSPDWLKLKCIKIADFQIVGWRADTGDQAVNSLVLADCSTPIPIYRGRVGTGFSHVERRQLHQALTAIETGSCPLATRPPQLGRHVRWVRPEFTAKVSYLEISLSGILRTPVYVGMIGPVPPMGRTTLVRGGKYFGNNETNNSLPKATSSYSRLNSEFDSAGRRS